MRLRGVSSFLNAGAVEGSAVQAHTYVRDGAPALQLPAKDAIASHGLRRCDQLPMGHDHEAAFPHFTEGTIGASEGGRDLTGEPNTAQERSQGVSKGGRVICQVGGGAASAVSCWDRDWADDSGDGVVCTRL